MELRSYSHLHLIQAIGGGIVTKCQNVDYRGKPALMFKEIKDIYDSEDAKTHSFSIRKGTAEDDDIKIKVDRTCLPIKNGQSIGSDSETCEFGNKGSCDEMDSELDEDVSFSSMTLKQVKERCKTKKRKLSKFVYLTNEEIKTCSPIKQEYSDLLLEEDEFDLKEPLSCWKSRLTKNLKAKKRRMHEHVSTFSQSSVVSPAKSKLILSDQGIPQSSRDLPTSVKVKLEVPEPGYSDSQDVVCDCLMVCPKQIEVGGPHHSGSESVVCVADDSFASCKEQAEVPTSDYLEIEGDDNNLSIGCNEQFEVPAPDCSTMQSPVSAAHDLSLSSSEKVGSCEILETDNESVYETRLSIIFTEEYQDCVVNTISYEYRQNDQPDSLSNVDPTIAEALVVDVPETTNSQALVLPVSEYKNKCVIAYPLPQGIPLLTSSPTKEYNFTSTSAESEIKDEEYITQLLNQDISPQALLSIKEHDSVSLSSGTEFKNGAYVHLLAQDTSTQALSPTKEHSSYICNSSQSDSLSSSNRVQVPDAAIDASPRCMEPSDRSVPSVLEDDNTGDQASATIICGSMCNSPLDNPCPSPTSCLAPEDDDLPATEVKQHLMFSGSDAARNCSWSHSGETTDEEIISAVTENRRNSELQRGPGKLFSTRKTISPISQEKLCRAMNSIDLYDDLEPYKCKIKLHFTKLPKDRTSSATSDVEGDEVNIGPGEPAQGSKNEASVTSKQSIRKRKNDVKGFHPKGILKFTQVSHGTPHLNNTCSSSPSYSQSAIAFSQRQMHDIECLATKLTRELKFMKDIVEEVTQSEVCLATSPRYSIDETGDQTAHVHCDMSSLISPKCRILVRAAIENANKVEETTKRWLSMMTRDCNRFCKIMRLTESESVGSGNTIHKERKKITFADEAGGELCHVKLFYNTMASPSDTNGETQELPGI